MSEAVTTIHFVRHGAVYNPGNIFYGRLPRFGLSQQGRQQIQALRGYFADKPIALIVSSPLLRARQTARLIAGLAGQPALKVSSLLNESHTPFDGKPIAELDARNWDIYSGAPFPYEQPLHVFQRAAKFIQRMLKNYAGQHIIAVTHADVVVFLALWANGYVVSFENKSRVEHHQLPVPFPAPASVTALSWCGSQELPQFTYYEAQGIRP